MEIDELKTEMDRQFEGVDRRFERIDRQFEAVETRFNGLARQITAEGENTRRHFDIVAEQMSAERNLALEGSMAAIRLIGELTASNAAEHAQFQARLEDPNAG